MKTPEELAREIDCHSDDCPTLELGSSEDCNCELVPKVARAIRLGQIAVLREASRLVMSCEDVDFGIGKMADAIEKEVK